MVTTTEGRTDLGFARLIARNALRMWRQGGDTVGLYGMLCVLADALGLPPTTECHSCGKDMAWCAWDGDENHPRSYWVHDDTGRAECGV